MLLYFVGLLKLMLNLLCTFNIGGKELCLHDFIKYTFNTGLRRDTCEPISEARRRGFSPVLHR